MSNRLWPTAVFIFCLLFIGLGLTAVRPSTAAPAQPSGGYAVYLPIIQKPELPTRRVNIPYAADGNVALPRRSIFWFGRVDPTNNYADVRLIYDNDGLHITFHIFDRHTWFSTNPTPATLTQWDAVSLYLNLQGNSGNAPGPQSYQFVAQLNEPPHSRAAYQAAYQGQSGSWSPTAVPFTTNAGWTGTAVNNNNGDDRGWIVSFDIPFSSLGLDQRPSPGTVWGLSAVVHDRDSASGSPASPSQRWPETAQSNQPSSWGQLRFGLPTYSSTAVAQGTSTVRHGENGATVTDAQVGGYFDCGEMFNPNFFHGWGDANHYNRANREQLNVQNQANLGDWPCLSKIYITFPLDQIPAGKQIISAELTFNHFGNSLPSEAGDSLIHVFTTDQSWQEQSINWNNAPLPNQNISVTRVPPLPGFPGWPGVPRQWQVATAVADAYQTGQPLRLILYATDAAMHSGKYFYSSDADLAGRPTLVVTWGE